MGSIQGITVGIVPNVLSVIHAVLFPPILLQLGLRQVEQGSMLAPLTWRASDFAGFDASVDDQTEIFVV